MDDETRPIACTLTPDEVEARKAGHLPGLAARVEGVRPTPDGYELDFAPADGILRTLAEVIDAERVCCRFLRFEITVTPAGGPITLRLSGPPGTREFLDALFER
jgi:hypothetical protein